jgi:hypothetical protein
VGGAGFPHPDNCVFPRLGIGAFLDAGFGEMRVQQVGGATEGFFEFYAEQVLPRLRDR